MNDREIEKKIMDLESLVEVLIKNSSIQSEHTCPICNSSFPVFTAGGVKLRKNAMCPNCLSLERHRSLWLFMSEQKDFERIFDDTDVKILHFAPEKCFIERFSRFKNIDYYPVDISRSYGIKEQVDIQNIPYSEDHFDYIICNHVLEHVENDKEAISELYRVIKPNGTAVISVPINHHFAETLEKKEYNTPELREKYYGQKDHRRYYGMDFENTLRNSGFTVSVVYPNRNRADHDNERYGVIYDEELFVCKK